MIVGRVNTDVSVGLFSAYLETSGAADVSSSDDAAMGRAAGAGAGGSACPKNALTAALLDTRDCCICEDDAVAPNDDLECEGKHGAGQHFTCDDCFGHHVKLKKGIDSLLQRPEQVFCPARATCGGTEGGCSRARSEPGTLAAKKKKAEHTPRCEQRLEMERACIAAVTAEELKVDELRRRVVDQALTLPCPRCGAPG